MDGLSSTRSSQDQAQYGEAHQEIRACTTIAKVLLDRGWNGVDRSRFVAEGKNLKGYEISIKEDQFDRIRAAAQAILAKKPEGSYEMDRWIACQFGDLKYLKEEIAKLWWWQKSSYINLGDSLGQLPLNIATRHTQVETVELLLSNGAIVDGCDPDKYQPLHIAARDGNVPMMTQLLNKNAPVNGLGAENRTPLHMAAHHGREGAVALLLSRGANINAQTSNRDGLKTPLLEAVLMNRSAVVKLLLEKCDIKVNICDALHHTPLRHAVMDGLIDIVKLLAPRSDLLGRSVSSGLSSYFFLTREVKPKQNAEEILAILKEAYEVQVNPPAERPTHREEVVSVH